MNDQSIEKLKGIGEKSGKLFRKLGIETVDDLLHYYPRAYEAYEEPVFVNELITDSVQSVSGRLAKPAEINRFKGLCIVTVPIKEGSKTLYVVWYNMPYIKSAVKSGESYIFRGRVVKKRGRLTMEQPEIFTPEAYACVMNSLRPIYGQTRGLGNKAISKATEQAIDIRELEREYMPSDIRKKYELAEYNFSIEHIHFPTDNQDLLFARKRLVFDEFFMFILAVRRLKESRQAKKTEFIIMPHEEVNAFKKALPYSLTASQEKVLNEVYADMSKGFVMNRLIQGDVGSGKTIIAMLALLQAAYSGYQGALMVPTEVLAKQHYESAQALFSLWGTDKKAILITGSMTAKEKRLAYEKIISHEADIIIGTHALIQEKVIYDKLALVITDEQHRFGVGQRELLGEKGNMPHVLVMSATPIPRTLAIIIYGDLDISVIDELPSERLPIKNCVVDIGYRKKAYEFIMSEVEKGHQAYIICPMVEASELIEAENVIDYTKRLKEIFPDNIKIEYLHGKMKGKEKNKIMERFLSGEIQVLVSTTVIEVGVNVPNATVMMIENAERFGLAQLHQLRGRVGRGPAQSYCIMVNCNSDSKEIEERLDILNRSNDGFYIASEDLKLRGPGDIFGMRQSGDMEFKLADIFTDADLLKKVSDEVKTILEEDPFLEDDAHRLLKKKLDIYLQKSFDKINL